MQTRAVAEPREGPGPHLIFSEIAIFFEVPELSSQNSLAEGLDPPVESYVFKFSRCQTINEYTPHFLAVFRMVDRKETSFIQASEIVKLPPAS